jgi:putative solute:sodium symporter small subunit
MTGNSALYWQKTRIFTLQLLLVWFVLTFGIVFFARELSTLTILGWPFSFYMAAQGLTLFYVALVGAYAWRMRRLDTLLTGCTHAE